MKNEGYRRVVIEIPVNVKAHLDELAKWRKLSIKNYLIGLIEDEHLLMKKEQGRKTK